jgi:putative SOS response-associated peptidase YedK
MRQFLKRRTEFAAKDIHRPISLKTDAPLSEEDDMCGRFTIYANLPVIARFVGAPEPTFDFEPRYNVAPTQSAPVCRLDAHQDRELARLRWGLVPHWAHDLDIGFKAINARSEGIADKPMFRAAFKSRRCLVPTSGFYEWKKVGKAKQPHFIHPKTGELFAFAGLWETWDKGGEPVETFTIITTEASGAMRVLHERMPVILPPHHFEEWLDPASTQTELLDLLRPAPDDTLTFFPVDTRVGNVKNQGADLIEPLT